MDVLARVNPVAILYFPLFAAICAVVVALRRRPRVARAGYAVLLLLSVLPYPLHVWYTWGYVTRSTFDSVEGGTAVFPGLVAFAAFGVALVAGLLALALLLVERMPLLSALTPMAAWLLYWYGALRLLYWRAPAGLMIDNVPLAWLFLFSAFAAALLLPCAWLALLPRGSHAEPSA